MAGNYEPGAAVTVQRTTHSLLGALVNADSLPTGTLVRNGADSAETVTVVNLSTGLYSFAFTIPSTWSLKDIVELRVNVTVGGTAGGAIVWSGVLSSPIVAGPLSVSQLDQLLTQAPLNLAAFKNSAKTFLVTVVDSAGVVVDLSGFTLKFVVESNITVPVEQYDVTVITVSGSNNEIANIATTAAKNNLTPAEYRWRLWDVPTSQVLAHGPFIVIPTSA